MTGLTKTRAEDRRKAHAKLHGALKRGAIKRPSTCEDCGKRPSKRGARVVAHHSDYSRPLDVAWLCRRCHSLRQQVFMMEYDVPDAAKAKAKREGVSLRALILGWLKAWVEKP